MVELASFASGNQTGTAANSLVAGQGQPGNINEFSCDYKDWNCHYVWSLLLYLIAEDITNPENTFAPCSCSIKIYIYVSASTSKPDICQFWGTTALINPHSAESLLEILSAHWTYPWCLCSWKRSQKNIKIWKATILLIDLCPCERNNTMKSHMHYPGSRMQDHQNRTKSIICRGFYESKI